VPETNVAIHTMTATSDVKFFKAQTKTF